MRPLDTPRAAGTPDGGGGPGHGRGLGGGGRLTAEALRAFVLPCPDLGDVQGRCPFRLGGLLPPWEATYPLLKHRASAVPVGAPFPTSGSPSPHPPLGSDSLMADLNIPFVPEPRSPCICHGTFYSDFCESTCAAWQGSATVKRTPCPTLRIS